MTYRPHVDGLRALALLWVLGFHFFPAGFRGGFTGVDIFFVLSGFLITRRILPSVESGTFSAAGFYLSRVRRLLPPLVTMLATALGVGWFLLLYDEYLQLARHAVAALSFVPNFQFLRESGYFTATHSKPLLHLWSLGVEEQFYAAWPWLLLLARRRRPVAISLVAGVALVSFSLSCYWVLVSPERAFFHPLSRLWELAIGGLLAFVENDPRHPVAQRWAPWAGLAGLLASLTIGREGYPGAAALMPVLGAALLIHYGDGRGPTLILNHPVLRRMGRLSYAWYLWHWPVLTMAPALLPGTLGPTRKLGLLLLSYLLAEATHYAVEKPLPALCAKLQRRAVAGAVLCAVLIACFSTAIAQGLLSSPLQRESRFYTNYEYFASLAIRKTWDENPCFSEYAKVADFEKGKCAQVANPAAPTVMLVGDSHAAYFSLGMKPVVQKAKANFVHLSAAGCLPYDVPGERSCHDAAQYLARAVERVKPDLLVVFVHHLLYQPRLAFMKGRYFPALQSMLWDFKARGAKTIVLMGQIPQWDEMLPKIYFRDYIRKRLPFPERLSEHLNVASIQFDDKLKNLALPPQTYFFSLRDSLCNEQGCLTKIGRIKKELVVYDASHLSTAAANYLAVQLLDEFGPRSPRYSALR